MKKIHFLSAVWLLLLSCNIADSGKSKFKRDDFIGEWKAVEKPFNLFSTKDFIVEFDLNADSSAVYKMKTESGIKEVQGTWDNKGDLSVLDNVIPLHADLTLRYSKNNQEWQILMMQVDKNARGMSLKINDIEYKKE